MRSIKFFSLILALSLFSCSKKPQVDNNPFGDSDTLEVDSIVGNHYIAIAVPLTGPYRHLGGTILEAATLAVENFNKTITPNHKIGTLIIDDGGLVSEALSRADIVVAQKSLGVIGHLNSEISVEVARKYSAADIVEISPASTNPKLTTIKDFQGYIFRTIGNDSQLAKVAADYMVADSSINKVAIFYNDRPYGISVGTELVNLLYKTNKKIVLQQTVPVRTTDHESTAELAVKAGADLVFFVGEYNDAAYLLQSLKAKNPNIKFMATEGAYHQEFITIAGKAAEAALIVGSSPADAKLTALYEDRYHRPATGYVATSYLATEVLLQAIKENDFKNPKAIAKSVASNPIFDAFGNLKESNFVIYKVVDGKFVNQSK